MASTSVVSTTLRLTAAERREQLLEVAVDLFSRKGFNGTTTREIAVAAGVTEAIIFRHFKTKEQLYSAIIDQRLKSPEAVAWISGFRAAMDRNDDEAVVRNLIAAIIQMHKNNPKFERLMLYAALEGHQIALLYIRQATESVVDTYRSYFLRRQKQGRLRPMSPDAALGAIVGMAQHFALYKYVHAFKDSCLSDDEALESFTRIVMDGFCNHKPAEAKAKTR